MANFSLRAVFGLDATGLKTELKTLRGEVNEFANRWGKIALAAGAAAFVGLARSAINLGSKLSDLAIQTGTNVESLQALNAVARNAGVPLDQFSKALIKTRTAASDAAEGNKEMQVAFRALNIDVQKFMAMPQEQKLEAIGRSYASASDKASAYNALSTIFGERVGPKMIEVLDTLATQGFDAVAKSAAEAGDVMSAETIMAMDKAADAIEAFKQRATMAVGNIIVNFRSEEGLALLGLQFMKVAGQFGAGIADALIEAGGMAKAVLTGAFRGVTNTLNDGLVDALQSAAEMINRILPKSFAIDVSSLDRFRSTGEGISDSITRAIAETQPSTFKKEVGEFWDKRIDDQRKIVDAMNAKDFGKDADKLRNAGNAIEASIAKGATDIATSGEHAGAAVAIGGQVAADAIVDGADAIVDAANKAAKELQKPVDGFFELLGVQGSKSFSTASDDALQEIVRANRQRASELTAFKTFGVMTNNFDDRLLAARLQIEAQSAQDELDMRTRIRRDFAKGGTQGVFRGSPDIDPILLDRLVNQFAKQLPEATKTALAVERIATGLERTGIIPRL